MKKLLVAAAVVLFASTAFAGEYHRNTSLKCSQCHAMHASRQHGLRAGSADSTYPVAMQGSGYAKLLIADGVNATCLACHDNHHYPDVYGTDTVGNDTYGGLRSAGALNGALPGFTLGTPLNTIGTTPAYADWMGHTLGVNVEPPGFPGTFTPAAGEGFNCSNCHAVHGSAGFRNLGLSNYMGYEFMPHDPTNPFGAAGPTYAFTTAGTADATKDISIAVDGASDSFKTNEILYGQGGNGMNKYCAVCHGDFHGATATEAGNGDFKRHPTSGVSRTGGLIAGSVDGMTFPQTDLVRPAWIDQGAGQFEVACLTCHKGHGNARGYALLYPSHTTAASVDLENGDGGTIDQGTTREYYAVRNLCVTCHPMGRF
jgi:hypothetical protein